MKVKNHCTKEKQTFPSIIIIKYNNTRDVYLYIYSVSAYMG